MVFIAASKYMLKMVDLTNVPMLSDILSNDPLSSTP